MDLGSGLPSLRFMAIRILLWVLVSLFSAIVLRFLSIVIQGRKNIKRAVGFFHPYTNDGGGGERVLWCAVKAIQEESPNLYCVVYTGDHDASPESLTTRAIDRFGVELLHPPQVVHLYKRKWIEEGTYPHFTMVGQSFGSVYLAWEALCKLTPLVYFDTSGYAFTYPLARMFGCNVICYTHYPTISLDMLSRVRQRNLMYNNDALVARSIWLSRCKLVYYTIFSWMYGFVGSFTHLAMVNSSWTQSHIVKLWKIPGRTKRVYPPCDTSGLQAIPLERQVTTPTIISVAQFRPEKAHTLQLEAFSIAVKNLDANSPRPKLQFVGSCRNKEDDDRLQKLKDRAIELEVDRDVEFYKNVMYRDLVRLLGGATAGIHSMIDEHFGISVVEYMAAGAIPIAHNSAGPQMDIVLEEDGKKTGFLARTVEEYADAILQLLRMPETERLEMAAAARKRASRFSEQRFYEDYKAAYMGCHIDGFIAVVGHTHVLQEGLVTGRAADVIAAANTAAEVALRLVRPGKKTKDVTEAIQKVAAAYDCKIVEGVLSHQLKQFVIDGNKVILSVANPDTRVEDAEFEENEVYAIDIVTSTGDGKVIVVLL